MGTVLQQFQRLGFHEIWLGGSDIGHDDEFTWADGSTIEKYFWTAASPQTEQGQCETCVKFVNLDNSSDGRVV